MNPDSKVEYEEDVPKYEDNIINDDNMKTIFNVLQGAYDDGYTEVTIVVGADRLGEFKTLLISIMANFTTLKILM